MLELKHVQAGYGERMILNGIDVTIRPGERISLIGHNGAGKSTIMKTINGQIRPKAGKVLMDGQEIQTRSPEKRVGLGIVQVPAGRRVFSQLSVEKNMRIGAFTSRNPDDIESDLETYFEKFPILRTKARRPAGTLSGGEQQLLAIARALMARPRVLLVDEPSLGLSPRMVDEVFSYLGQLGDSNVAVVLAEQNVRMALKVTDRAIVLSQGAIQTEMSAEQLIGDAEFRKAYLGG